MSALGENGSVMRPGLSTLCLSGAQSLLRIHPTLSPESDAAHVSCVTPGWSGI